MLRPRASRPQRDAVARFLCSRFALIAGGTPAVPANHLKGFTALASMFAFSVFLFLHEVSLVYGGTNPVTLQLNQRTSAHHRAQLLPQFA